MKKFKPPSVETKKAIVAGYKSGTSAITLAKMFGYSKVAVHTWIRQDREGNDLQRRRRPGSGRMSKFEPAQVKRLLRILKRPASEYGFETDLWNTPRIRIVCKKHLKISVSRMAIWRTLRRFDQSFKKVQKQ